MKYRRAATACVAIGLVAGVAACSSGSSSSSTRRHKRTRQ